jgi:hypothetical protein
MTITDRVTGALAAAGHSLVVNGTTRTGIVTCLTPTGLARWFDAAALAALPIPARQAILPGTDSSVAGQSVTYGGELFVVRRVIPVTWRGVVVARRVIFA